MTTPSDDLSKRGREELADRSATCGQTDISATEGVHTRTINEELEEAVSRARDAAMKKCGGVLGDHYRECSCSYFCHGAYDAEKATYRAKAIEAATAIRSLTEERDRLREYCAAAARDYSGLLDMLEGADAGILTKHFPKTIKELRETSEFMALASAGKADHSLYEGEFAKLAADNAALTARVGELEAALKLVKKIDDAFDLEFSEQERDQIHDALRKP